LIHRPYRILSDLLGLRRRHDQDCNLRALASLKRGKLLLEHRLLLGRQGAGEVGDPGSQLGNGLQVLREGGRCEAGGEHRQSG
jgi:hypothetical protein